MNDLEQQIEEFSMILDKYIKAGKINHAYLIETNITNRLDIAMQVVKQIISFDEKSNINDLSNCFDLHVLSTESQTIKKEEILNIKEHFKTKSIYNSKRVYIIEEAEKLNSSSANTLLKFLEEPEDGIIAILITNNRNSVIDTIVSRCQIIRYYAKESNNIDCDYNYSERLFNFLMCIEINKENSIAYINQLDIKEYIDRQNITNFFKNMLYVYDDVLHVKIGLSIEYFKNHEDKIKQLADLNSLVDIKNKINAINLCIERIKYNANIKLLLDKFIILMAGVDINA